MVPQMADEWGSDDDLWLEATLRIEDPNGPVAFVWQYLEDFAADRLDAMAAVLDANYGSDYSLNLTDLLGPGWVVSGRERVTDGGDQTILYLPMEPTIIRTPAAMQVQFIVRHTPDGWRLVGIFEVFPS